MSRRLNIRTKVRIPQRDIEREMIKPQPDWQVIGAAAIKIAEVCLPEVKSRRKDTQKTIDNFFVAKLVPVYSRAEKGSGKP